MSAGGALGPVLVTGATGFVGAAVARALREGGYRIRLLVRDPARLPGDLANEESHPGNLAAGSDLGPAVRGCWGVVHCAADYRLALAPGDAGDMIRTNVGGTRGLLEAADAAGVKRLVHCSTVGTLHFQRSGRVCSEADTASSAHLLPGPYKRSKWAAEQLALGFAGTLQVVVVQPSTPVGAGDRRPTPTGAIIRDFLAGRIPAVVNTGLNLVDVEAVARGHVLALERGTPGRSYILGDRNWTLVRLLTEVAGRAGHRPPSWRVPLPLAYGAAATSELVARLRGRPPTIPLTSVRMAAHPMWVTSARARRELGWTPGDLGRALDDAVRELGASA